MTRLNKSKKAMLRVIGLIGTSLLLWFGVLSGRSETVAQGSVIWPQISLTQEFSGLSQPVHVIHAGDGSGRLFVVEQIGRIRLIKDGVLLSTPFLNITSRVGCCGERGLLSVAFPPEYASKGYFYVYYTNTSGNIVVARYFLKVNPDSTINPDVTDP
ncbi:MAG: PQQ-dependent sugar dehydrogenase, partial [Ignavibacteriales bacterium]